MPRQARLDAPGTLHHVIVRGIEKRGIVDDKVDRDNFVLRMGQIAHETETVPKIPKSQKAISYQLKKYGFNRKNNVRRISSGFKQAAC